MRQIYKRSSAILLLLPSILATVASVPTSVLVQNSELSGATTNDIASLNSLKLKNNPINKVKRSSGNVKSSSQDLSTSKISEVPDNNGLEKKSSPEVVPAAFNSPPARPVQMGESVDKVSYGLPENPDLINTAIAAGLTASAVEAAAAAHQRDFDQSQIYDENPPTLLHKRGISSAQQQAYTYGNDDSYYNNPFLSSAISSSQLPNGGVWLDEIDPAATYNDLQGLEEYTPMQHAPSYRNKAYDNLQNLLNAEAYLEPVPLPYASRYYSASDADRNKRSNSNKYNRYADMRTPKQDAKITPADMLALVALVEAGERSRKDEPESPALSALYANDGLTSRNNFFAYDYPAANMDDDVIDQYNMATSAPLYEPASVVDYYGTPMNLEKMSKYEFTAPREHKHSGRNRLAIKRFMVAKKNRPLGKFLNEPVAKPSILYNLNDENYF